MKIKVCGMRDPANISLIAALKPDYMGFIFYPESPRFAGNLKREHLKVLSDETKRVGVFVNQKRDLLLSMSDELGIRTIQLHGGESPEQCYQLSREGYDVIKAISVLDKLDLSLAKEYTQSCRYLLFDTKCESFGGSGKKFMWDLLEGYEGDNEIFLSGGINPLDAPGINRLKHSFVKVVDINSGFETAPGIKDVEKVSEFMSKIK